MARELAFLPLLMLMPVVAAEPDLLGKPKKLIEFGWDEPDPAFIGQHAAVLRRSPFDGTVFHVNYQKEDGSTGSFTWEGWGRRQFREADLEPSIGPLRDADLGKFRHNFLRFNVTPGDVDWFDDYRAILENARLAAWFARETRCPGIMFEVEQYKGKLFEYSRQRDAATKSWDVYAAQARLRGRQVMEAFQKGYPGLTVFLSLGYSYPWLQAERRKLRLAEVSYGLLAPFLDGLLDAAEGQTRLVDGHETAYSYMTPEQFVKGREIMAQSVLPIVADRTKYAQRFSFSFGIWMDRNSNKDGWHSDDFSKNGHSPENLEKILAKALDVADEYVWLYSERLKWWTPPEGAPDKLPEAYDAAVRRAKAANTAARARQAKPYPRITKEAFQARLPFFDIDPKLPLEARVVDQQERSTSIRQKIVLRGAQGFLAPGYLEMPKTGAKPYPLVLLLHGWSGSKEVWWQDQGIHSGGVMRKALLGAGYAVLALDAAAHGERSSEIDYQSVNAFDDPRAPARRNYFSFAEISVQTVKDYRRALEYMAQRGDVDMGRIGLIGYSMGGMDAFLLLAVEPRIQVGVACVPPLYSGGYNPASPIDYSWGIGDRPFLMIMGRFDNLYDEDKVNASFRAYLEGSKAKLTWYDRDHTLTSAYVPEALGWIKQHLPCLP